MAHVPYWAPKMSYYWTIEGIGCPQREVPLVVPVANESFASNHDNGESKAHLFHRAQDILDCRNTCIENK